jgi:hypothetical protein
MTPSSDLQERLRRYLLGQLDEPAREQTEQTILTNDDAFEELLIIEDEITDDYLAGKLDPPARSAFEKHFLATPERYQQLSFARALEGHIARTARPAKRAGWPAFFSQQSLGVRASLIAIALAVVAGAVWFLRNQKSSPSFATLTLTISQPTRAEGVEAPKLHLPLREDSLRIVLLLPERASGVTTYRVQLDTESGKTRTIDAHRENDTAVSIDVPAAELEPGRYSIKLFAKGPDGIERRISGNYLFTLE